MDTSATVKITLELNQKTNLDELMAHLTLMQDNIPGRQEQEVVLLADFSVHEGELSPVDPEMLAICA